MPMNNAVSDWTFRPIDPESESGFTLIELLVTMAVMIVMLIAIARLLDVGNTVAARDNERATTLSAVNSGLGRFEQELRRACALFPPTGGASVKYCGSSAAFSPGTDMCNTSPAATTNCIDFLLPARPSSGQSWTRVIYNCSVTDPTAATGINRCVRYATAPTSTLTQLASPPTAAPPNTAEPIIRGVANSAGSPQIFTYCRNSDYQSSSCTAGTIAANAQVVRITIDITRKGTRKSGLKGTFRLDEAVDLKNINRDFSP